MAQNSYMQEWSLLTARKSGRLIVSGGESISEYYETDVALPTLYVDETHKPFLECVITKGTFFTLKKIADNAEAPAGTPHPQRGKTVATVCDGTTDVPQGLVVLDAMRSFAQGDKFGLSFITEGFVEFPIIDSLNDTVVVGDKIAIDEMGRPVVYDASTAIGEVGATHSAPVGVVKAVEIIGTDEFDTGMLEYMTLPYEDFMNALIRRPLELTDPATAISTTPLFGYRGNLDVADVEGAMRVQLYKL